MGDRLTPMDRQEALAWYATFSDAGQQLAGYVMRAVYGALVDEHGLGAAGIYCPGCNGDGDDPWNEGGDCLLCMGTGAATGERLRGVAKYLSDGAPALNRESGRAHKAEREVEGLREAIASVVRDPPYHDCRGPSCVICRLDDFMQGPQ